MPDDIKLDLIRGQRDNLARLYHELIVEQVLVQSALAEAKQKLTAAEQRIAELEAQTGQSDVGSA